MQEPPDKCSYSTINTGVWHHHLWNVVQVLTGAHASYPVPGGVLQSTIAALTGRELVILPIGSRANIQRARFMLNPIWSLLNYEQSGPGEGGGGVK